MEEKFLQTEGPGAERNSPFRTRRNLNSSSASFDISFLKGKNTFGRDEKLKSKKIIDQLFKEGKSVSANGFTLVYLVQPLSTIYPAQAAFSAPKKNFKSSPDRNRIKRLMREAYRLNKISLYEKLLAQKQQMAIMFIYKGKEMPGQEAATKAMLSCLKKLI
jgi:ribonuclease P protein component